MATCRKCEANPAKQSVCLVRVNELGVDGLWECAPRCNSGLSQEESLLTAIGIYDDADSLAAEASNRPAPAGQTR